MVDANGHRAYTRDGSFSRAADGTLRNAQDWRLAGVRVPADALTASAAPDGTVTATFADGARPIGRIRIAEFAAPERLRNTGGTLFEATRESGPARMEAPGGESGPKLRFGMLEESNVSIVESMMRILTAQRAYEANAKAVHAKRQRVRFRERRPHGSIKAGGDLRPSEHSNPGAAGPVDTRADSPGGRVLRGQGLDRRRSVQGCW